MVANPLTSLDEQAFGALAEPHRRELQVHCYRMLGSLQDAEDMVQETFLRAWRRRQTFEGRASFRAWLYKIATNACLDALDRRPKRVVPRTHQPVSSADQPIPPSVMEPIWLEPYPDEWLAADETSPERQVVAREHITLAFVAALHRLPPRQRAVLLLRDVLDWQASETAELLDMTVPAVKSALHRARATLAAHEPTPASDDPALLDAAARERLDRYVRAWHAADVDALLALLREDASFSMPPIPSWYQGHAEIGRLVGKTIFAGDAAGRWRLLPTRANRQQAFGLYRLDAEQGVYHAYAIQVVSSVAGQIADITTFRSPGLVARFHLPETLPANPAE